MPTSIKLYHRCKATRWAHLPVAGGWYNQHPQLVDEWDILLQMEQDRQERERQEMMDRTGGNKQYNVKNV